MKDKRKCTVPFTKLRLAQGEVRDFMLPRQSLGFVPVALNIESPGKELLIESMVWAGCEQFLAPGGMPAWVLARTIDDGFRFAPQPTTEDEPDVIVRVSNEGREDALVCMAMEGLRHDQRERLE